MTVTRRLRTVFIGSLAAASVAVAALTGWLLWHVWQEWRFEQKITQITAGMTPEDVDRLLGSDHSTFWHSSEVVILPVGNVQTPAALSPRFVGAHWYCIYLTLKDDGRTRNGNKRPSEVVQVFRLPKPPKSYQPKTEIGRASVGRMDERPPLREDQGYIFDFREFVSRRAVNDLGIPYELIHSDTIATTYDTQLVSRGADALRSGNVDARRSIAQSLAGVSLRHPIAVPALVAALEDEDSDVRLNAEASLKILATEALPK